MDMAVLQRAFLSRRCGSRGHGYVARRFPYWGRRRPSARMIERVAVIATKRIVVPLSKVKLDMRLRRGHTQTTVTRTMRMSEVLSPLEAGLVALVLTIVTVILILPR
jgi:hypothetical protein